MPKCRRRSQPAIHTAVVGSKTPMYPVYKSGPCFSLVAHQLRSSDFYYYHLALSQWSTKSSPRASPSPSSSRRLPMPCPNHLRLMCLRRIPGPQVRHIRRPALRLRVHIPPSIAAPRTTTPRPQTATRLVLLITLPSRIIPRLRTTRRPRRLTHPQPHLILPTRRQSLIMANPTITTQNPTRRLPCAPHTTLRSTIRLALSTASHARTGLTVLRRDSRPSATSRTFLSLAALSTLYGTLLIAAGAGTSRTRRRGCRFK